MNCILNVPSLSASFSCIACFTTQVRTVLISGYRSSAQKEATLARSGHTLVVGDGDGVETGEGPGQGVGPPLVRVHIPRLRVPAARASVSCSYFSMTVRESVSVQYPEMSMFKFCMCS